MGGILFDDHVQTTGLAERISQIDRDDLCNKYRHLMQNAPRRKDYFVGHKGELSEGRSDSNRFEEHLAMALYNLKGCWPRSDGGWLRLLDYQFPLKASKNDKGIGKVDLLGITECGRIAIVELKVTQKGDRKRGDAPLHALMEGLRYAAIVEANIGSIAVEARKCFGIKIANCRPIIQILAPKAWWHGWFDLHPETRKKAGHWEPEFVELIRDTEKRLDVTIECMALADVPATDIDCGPSGNRPQLAQAPAFYPVLLSGKQHFGARLPHEP